MVQREVVCTGFSALPCFRFAPCEERHNHRLVFDVPNEPFALFAIEYMIAASRHG